MAKQEVGYQLVDRKGKVLQQWGGQPGQMCGFPNPLILPNGDHILAAPGPGKYQKWEVRVWLMDEPEVVEMSDAEKLKAVLDYAKSLGLTIPA